MTKYLTKFFLFSIFIISILKGIKNTVPFYWGNKMFAQRINYIKQSGQDFNCFLFGSSITHRHIIPNLLNGKTQLKTYNLGTSSQFKLETNYLIENLLNNNFIKIDKDDLIILDRATSEPKAIADVNLHTIKSKYYMDTKRLVTGVKYFYSEGNYHQIYNHLVSYFENQLCIGELINIIKIKTTGYGELNEIEKSQFGFFALDQHQKFSDSWYLKNENQKYLNEVKIGKIGDRPEQKIRLEPIKITSSKGEIYNAYINYGNPISDAKLYFDRTHYNYIGAKKYTNLLSKRINEVINK